MKVLKFGGTSVGQPARMHQVAKIVTSHKGPKIVILSALSGTTNSLVNIGEDLSSRKHDDASHEIEALYEHYLKFQDELVQKENSRVKAQYVINEHFSFIRSLLKVEFNENYTKELLARGELLSTELFSIYLEEEGYKNVLLPALDFMAIDENDEPDMDFIQTRLKDLLKNHEGNNLFITQGYICLNSEQKIDNLKRGGSDYTASLIGAASNAEIVEMDRY